MDRLRLTGKYDHAVDAKGRVTLPARFREYFAGGAILVRFPEPDGEPCISVFREDSWEEFNARHLGPLDTFKNPQDAWVRRDIYANMFDVDVDKAGRILLPSELTKDLDLSGSVKILGVMTNLEIWNPETLAKRQAERQGTHA